MKDNKYENGDLVEYKNQIYYFADYCGKVKVGNEPWREQCLLCPISPKTNKPDNRILKSIAFKFRYRFNVDEITLYKDSNE